MGLTFHCRNCHKRLAVAGELQGRRIRCPGCKEIMRVPAEELSQSAAEADMPTPLPAKRVREAIAEKPVARPRPAIKDEDRAEDSPEAPVRRRRVEGPGRRTPPPTRKARNPWLFALCAGGTLALLALGVFVAAINVNWNRLDFWPLAQKAKQGAPAEEAALPAPPKLEAIPDGPAPPAIAAEMRRQVIRATAYLKVTRAANVVQEGSGFFAAEPGLVITSAHVVGMGAHGCSAPVKVDVVVNSGEADEVTLHGHVLAADAISDLAVLRVTDVAGKLPPPLSIGSSQTLSELQKVYIFGFPLGAALGKNITVIESSVSALRKDGSGAIRQVQVGGNILPGNSGGPVVDSRGTVVGMAVAFVGGAQLSFAVPGEKVHDLLRGRVEDLQFGEPYADKEATRLPLLLNCLDPLQRLRDVKIEVWVGNGRAAPPLSFKKPEASPGDGPRQVMPVAYKNGSGAIEVALPTLNKDQVLWVQPVLTDAGGTTRWTVATSYRPADLPPLQRIPANIRILFDAAPEWSIKIDHADDTETIVGNNKMTAKTRVEVNLLELAQKDGKEAEYKLYVGPCKAFYEFNGVKGAALPQVLNLLSGERIRYTTNLEGSWQQRSDPGLKPNVAQNPRIQFNQLVNDMANAYESTCLAFPNRLVQPRESWTARLPMLTVSPFGADVATLVVTCTYEGSRMVDGEAQAVITMAGIIEGGNPPRTLGGKVTGKFHVAIDKGYVASAQVKIDQQFGRGNIFTHHLIDVALTRVPGNALGIVPKGPTGVAKGKTVFETASKLDATDPIGLRPQCFAKTFPVQLEAGQSYVIEMNKDDFGLLDPYLVLRDPEGLQVAEDDDSGGAQNARIVYTATRSGIHQICATTCAPGQIGAFRLIVAERATPQGEKARDKKESDGKR